MAILDELAARGAVLTDKHFVYKSTKHGSGYVNFDPAFSDVPLVWETCNQMVDPFLGDFDVVVGPATGGVVLCYVSALAAMLKGHAVAAVWADKDGDVFVFERDGFVKALTGKRVLVVDDVMTNPNEDGSVFKVCRLVEEYGGIVIGVSLVCNRCHGTAEQLHVPRLEQLASVSFEAMPRSVCEERGLCAAEVPIVEDIGHGAGFKAQNPDYLGGYIKLLG